MVSKSFPRKQVWTKNCHQKLFGRKFFMVAKSFPRKQVSTKNFHQTFSVHNFSGGKIISSELNMKKKILVQKFLWVQNNFLGSRIGPKLFIKNFLVENYFGFKIISSKTGLNQKCSSKSFLSKIFYLQNNFLENRFQPKIFIKHCLGRNFFMVAKPFPRKQVWTINYHTNFLV
jgi:hypothetical protein